MDGRGGWNRESSIFWKSLDRNFTEGEGRKVVCAPDDGLILPPLAPSDIGQVLGRGGPGQFQGDGFSGATHGGQLSRAVIEIKPFDDFFLPFHVLIKDQLDFVFPCRWRMRRSGYSVALSRSSVGPHSCIGSPRETVARPSPHSRPPGSGNHHPAGCRGSKERSCWRTAWAIAFAAPASGRPRPTDCRMPPAKSGECSSV